jgi:Major intrinsic protein
LARYGGHPLQPWQTVLVLSAVSALWLVVAVYFLGDISAHFNPATTLAFALRRDMDWVMAGACWVVQFAAAACRSLLARGRPYPCGHLPVTAGRYASASQLTVARRAVWADARTWADRKDRLVSHPHLTRIFI